MASPSYDQTEAGTELPPRQYQVTRRDLVRYAGASGDFNVIHWNERIAKAVGLPDVIAHGMFTMAQAGRFVTEWAGDPGAVTEFSVRFSAPVVVPDAAPKRSPRRTKAEAGDESDAPDPQAAATGLLERALRIGHEKDDADWLHNSAVKAQMKRMDPSFSEKSLGFKSFSDFLRSRTDIVELDESSTTRKVRLR